MALLAQDKLWSAIREECRTNDRPSGYDDGGLAGLAIVEIRVKWNILPVFDDIGKV